MLFSGCPRIKCSEILSFTCLGIFLAGVEPVFARLEFSNHLYPRGSNEWASFGERCRVFVENFFRLSRGAEGQLSPSGCVLLSKRFCCSPCSLHLCVLCVLCRSREHRETSLEATLISHIYFPADGCNIHPTSTFQRLTNPGSAERSPKSRTRRTTRQRNLP